MINLKLHYSTLFHKLLFSLIGNVYTVYATPLERLVEVA